VASQLAEPEFGTLVKEDLAVPTAREEVSLGIATAEFGSPRPELNGLRVKVPGRPEVYLMDQGYRRWVPNPATYNSLFRDWNGIREELAVTDIPVGTPVTDGAILARGSGTAPVYLIDGGVKRWVTSPAAMDRYYFNWQTVYNVPLVLLQNIPAGSNIDA
jgi:hypothetical protein